MNLYCIAVQQPGGHWARRDEKTAASLEAYMSLVRPTLGTLTRFGDRWKVMIQPDNDSDPMVLAFDPAEVV